MMLAASRRNNQPTGCRGWLSAITAPTAAATATATRNSQL